MGAASFDKILEDYVGGFGRYQILNTLVINLVTYCAFYPIIYYIFTAYQPPHRCRIPICESENQTKVSFLKLCRMNLQLLPTVMS